MSWSARLTERCSCIVVRLVGIGDRNVRDQSGRTGFAPRSLLFVPGNRSDMLPKVARIRPDAVAVDWEDAVSAADKDVTRANSLGALTEARPGADTVLVRVNGVGTP